MELPIHMGIPTKSVVSLPVVAHARFGRSIPKSDTKNLNLGCIYHMGRSEPSQNVTLDMNHLCSHTLNTGSTCSVNQYRLLHFG